MTTVAVLNNSGFDLIDAKSVSLGDGKTLSYTMSITPISFYYKDDTSLTTPVTSVTISSQKAVIIFDKSATSPAVAGVTNSATAVYTDKFSVVKGVQTQFATASTAVGDWVAFVREDAKHKVKSAGTGFSSTWIWIILIVIVIAVVLAVGGGVYWKYFHKKS
jgi:hypothetical protein